MGFADNVRNIDRHQTHPHVEVNALSQAQSDNHTCKQVLEELKTLAGEKFNHFLQGDFLSRTCDCGSTGPR